MNLFYKILLSFIIILVELLNSIAGETDSILILSYVEYSKGNYENAINNLNQLSNNLSSDELSIKLRGESYYHLGLYEKSTKEFLKLDKIQEGMGSLFLAKIYALQGNYTKAAFYLEHHLKSKYRVGEAGIKADEDFSSFQNSTEWKNIWKNDWYSKTDLLISDTKYLTRYKRYEEAIELIDQKIDQGTKNHEVYAVKSEIFTDMGQYHLALEAINKAVKYKKEPDYFVKRAGINNRLKNYNDAINDYNYVLEKEPYKVNLFKNISQNYFANEEFSVAIQYMDKYLGYYPEDIDALYQFASILYENKNYLTALKYYNKLIKTDPGNMDYYSDRGMTYLMTNAYQFAENDFSMILDIYPNNGKAYVNRGLARYKKGDNVGACKDWNRAKLLGDLMGVVYLQQYCEK